MTRWEPFNRRSWLVRGVGQATTYSAMCVAALELLRREGVVSLAVYSRPMLVAACGLWVALLLWRWTRERQALE